MRKFKFRAWFGNRMGLPFDVFDPVFLATGGTFPEGTVFMQFTGLYDHNGKEIYEGDVLLNNGNYRWEVQWHNDHACFMVLGIDNSVVAEIIDDINMKVIGNIYEPQFLKHDSITA